MCALIFQYFFSRKMVLFFGCNFFRNSGSAFFESMDHSKSNSFTEGSYTTKPLRYALSRFLQLHTWVLLIEYRSGHSMWPWTWCSISTWRREELLLVLLWDLLTSSHVRMEARSPQYATMLLPCLLGSRLGFLMNPKSGKSNTGLTNSMVWYFLVKIVYICYRKNSKNPDPEIREKD